MGQHRAASHVVSSLGGRNTHTYFEVLLARLTYEKGERWIGIIRAGKS
jgi:hypothetical protein